MSIPLFALCAVEERLNLPDGMVYYDEIATGKVLYAGDLRKLAGQPTSYARRHPNGWDLIEAAASQFFARFASRHGRTVNDGRHSLVLGSECPAPATDADLVKARERVITARDDTGESYTYQGAKIARLDYATLRLSFIYDARDVQFSAAIVLTVRERAEALQTMAGSLLDGTDANSPVLGSALSDDAIEAIAVLTNMDPDVGGVNQSLSVLWQKFARHAAQGAPLNLRIPESRSLLIDWIVNNPDNARLTDTQRVAHRASQGQA